MRGANGRELGARLGDRLLELVDDEQTRFLRFRHRFAHDVDRDPGDLDVHLDRGDAVDRTRDLEVHLAQRVFDALDVGEDACFLPLRMSPIATPATCFLIGTPASISESVVPQTDAIDDEPLDSSVSLITRIV